MRALVGSASRSRTLGVRSLLCLPPAFASAPYGADSLFDRPAWWLTLMARLKPDQPIESATAAFRGVQPQIRAETMPAKDRKSVV